jgi:hypothetical protein
MDLMILQSQANSILKLVQILGINPNDFSWGRVKSITSADVYVSRLMYKDERFFYQFDYSSNLHYAYFSLA